LNLECGDIDFEVISATENSNKFQKTKFWGKKYQFWTWEHLNVCHSIRVEGIVMCLWRCWKNLAMGYMYTLQNNVICCVHPTL
jgi:hypothetical protein